MRQPETTELAAWNVGDGGSLCTYPWTRNALCRPVTGDGAGQLVQEPRASDRRAPRTLCRLSFRLRDRVSPAQASVPQADRSRSRGELCQAATVVDWPKSVAWRVMPSATVVD